MCRFLKKWGGLVFGGLGALLLALVGAGWLWRRKEAELAQVRDQLVVEEAQREIAVLQATRAGVAAQVGEQDAAVDELDVRLAVQRRRLVEAHDGMEGLSDDDVAAMFSRLGY